MIHCKFTAFHAVRGRAPCAAATVAMIVLTASFAGCQDIPIARQRLAELVGPRDAAAASAAAVSGNASTTPKAATGVAASSPRSSRSRKPHDWSTPYQIKPGDMAGYSLHM
ncbi:hypothetical protein OIV57_22595 [Burkholderia pseudomallei]|uniref:hypothetical protein n=1 Tax=Burkholderia pseudomallei TaxID=28450 RepID=UPI0014052A09|nr:hypothetical protein [Burkholderia pseudomallei]MCV9914927.1 hypothetical protein [Burkholderia pseudomallei]MCW0070965.1 hypothetical protein [Burkholderia pseudomallei]